MHLLRLEGIEKHFGKIQALRGVDLDLNHGEALGIVGDNGAGKSTLLKIMSGVVMPDHGRIFLDGKDVHFRTPKDARARGIEMVYQDLSLCETLTVAQNVFLGREPVRRLLGVPLLDKKALYDKTQRVLEELRIKIPSIRAQVKNLSGGQRQAVAIGRAVTFKPKILILDEPTAALAVREVQKVLDLINNLKSHNIATILISHRLQDVMTVTDRVVVMYEGKKVAERKTRDLKLEELINLISQSKSAVRGDGSE